MKTSLYQMQYFFLSEDLSTKKQQPRWIGFERWFAADAREIQGETEEWVPANVVCVPPALARLHFVPFWLSNSNDILSSEGTWLWNGTSLFLGSQDWWVVSVHIQLNRSSQLPIPSRPVFPALGLSPGEKHNQGWCLGEQTDPEGKTAFPRKFPQVRSKSFRSTLKSTA